MGRNMDANTALGAYRLEEKLGEGGMGVVYRAWDTELDRQVAIKTLISHMVSDPEVLERFAREAKAASRLVHPSIVTIYHVGAQGETRFIAMEYVEGKTLKKAIGGKPMPLTQICSITIQLADALALAHEKNVVHRDLKSENVMLTPRMTAKILDFGLAKLKEPESQANSDVTVLTQVGVVLGTVSHMSPEQALGLEVDGRTDIFALGVMLYEMTTGQMPFTGPNAQAVLARVLNQEPAPVAQLNPDVPPELAELVHACLRKDRNMRPLAPEVLSRMKRIEASLSVSKISSMDIRSSAGVPPMASTPNLTPVMPMPIPSSIGIPSVTPVAPAAATWEKAAPVRAPLVEADPEKLKTATLIYRAVHGFKIALSLGLLSVPLAFLSAFFISGGIIKPEVVQGTKFLTVVSAIVEPALGWAQRVFNFNYQVQGWNFVTLGFCVVAFIVRHLILVWFSRVDNAAKNKMVAYQTALASSPKALADRASGHRLQMMREAAGSASDRRRLAFLAAEITGLDERRQNEDANTLARCLGEYHKFAEGILRKNGAWKSGWTGDALQAAFNKPADALQAAQELLTGLAWFNQGFQHMREPLSLRIGLSAGEVNFPADSAIQQLRDPQLDLAGNLEKQASAGAVRLPREMHTELGAPAGFADVEPTPDGRAALEWRAPGSSAASAG
jgi:serine/threonine protein kinase/class 3 adenylate cyclase